jgi:hypothetical protein
MRRRAERAFLLAVLLAGAGWILREPLRATRWQMQGAAELIWISPALPLPRAAAVPVHVAHAGGAYRGFHYTNALEALNYNYARGARWFEMDFLTDARGDWWAVHDWSGVRPASAPFRVVKMGDVLGWFVEHPDARLITDTKGDNRALLRKLQSAPAELRARVHPQIYRFREYPLARSAGFAAPIFTTYRSAYPWWVIGRFVRRHPVLAVTVTREQARDACAALSGTVPILTHTVNDSAEAAHLMQAGIAGIYTDELLP